METKTLIPIVLSVLIVIIVIFLFIGGASTTMKESSDSITTANNCSQFTDPSSGVAFDYNATSGSCHNTTTLGSGVVATARLKTLPLNNLFNSSGVVWLMVMAGVMLLLIGTAFIKKRK